MTNHDDVSAKVDADEAMLSVTVTGDAELEHKHGRMEHPLEGLDSESLASFNLRRIRKELGMSQQQIADRIAKQRPGGVKLSQTQIAKIERGERPWRLNEMTAIAGALDIMWDEFFRVRPGDDFTLLDVDAARLRYERAKSLEEDARDAWREAARARYEREEEFLRLAAKHDVQSPHVMFALEMRWMHQAYVDKAQEDLKYDTEDLETRKRKANEFAQQEWERLAREEKESGDE
ncbi:helix-turn-helix domain-containing protein [Streptomyces rapamycinicus]|uniref:HTH cro/C1-type domain-containing protein n=2 Tax=Streptomyces rapamycinicus TaxID=1226757 RepID=A0A0A0NFY4_STRRN|nr:helix-turn-helix transcriptional regulator [Streptomyces rapamycinicus]AGP56156.1 hypothetical protein M271_23210 [Streptomyces rapamycinicus NRRL 5491]MBB4783762.1 transcriptional regulator with XRE-family HTH domain [Streptomyces rapamycinicus]RLV80767.1 hypothetical protein D3C57_120320 [Streptomyces rapamycinicus NRRL 5491]UTO64120.1 helix-turn-helix transcriptional regulator [Streptomyces rapamycinicus]UTP32075.1 helix-turn-helix transcriptional regulator [Streptomyces rapamycinicus NR